ncbi:SEL1-like repeat protein [Pseudomonas sp. LB3P81]
MYSHASALSILFNLCTTLNGQVSRIKDQTKEPITKGLALYNLGEFDQAKVYLTIGATSGDSASQYALGEIARRKAGSVTEEARKWYLLAGAQDHVYALLRLADAGSLKKAKELAQAKADKGDSEAMLELYELDQKIETLKKAADAGSMEGKYILAVKYDKDQTLIADSSLRRATIDTLLQTAAVAGFSKAIHWYANRPPVSVNLPVRRQWMEKRAALSDVNGVLEYGYALGGVYADDDGVDTQYGTTKDLVKGYGLIWLVSETTREFRRHAEASENLEAIAEDMTPVQITAGKAFAKQWEMSHPPMSEFRLTFNDVA